MQQIGIAKSERCTSTSPLGREAVADPLTKEVAELNPIASGSVQSNRIMPCEPSPDTSDMVAGETPDIIQNDEAGDPEIKTRRHTTCSPFVYEAMRLLEEHGYEPSRPAGKDNPVAIVALKGREVLKIAVIRSRKPVPDAKTLHRFCPEKVDRLCAFAKTGPHKTMIWVNSPLIGWRYYRVDTGGISRDWDFAKLMEE